MATCKRCGEETPAGVKFCTNCGAPVEAESALCASCGAKLPEGVKFCTNCGAAVAPAGQAALQTEAQQAAPQVEEQQAPVQPAPMQQAAPQPAPAQQAAPPAPAWGNAAGQGVPARPGAVPPQGYVPPVYAPQAQPAKKSHVGLFIGLGVGALVLIGIIVAAVLGVSAAVRKAKTDLDDASKLANGFAGLFSEAEQEEGEPAEEPAVQGDDAEMARAGVRFDMNVGATVVYVTHNGPGDVIYVGDLTVDEMSTVPMDQATLDFARENGLGDLSGYVHKRVKVTATFPVVAGDEEHGPAVSSFIQDYYSVTLLDESFTWETDSYGKEYERYTAKVNGEETYVYIWDEYAFEEKSDETVFTETFDVMMPADYDGVVVCFRDSDDPAAAAAQDFLEAYKTGADYHLFRVK